MYVELTVDQNLRSTRIKYRLTISEVLSFLYLGKIHARLDGSRSVLNLMVRGKTDMLSHSSYEDNLGFLKDSFYWDHCTINGLPIGNYRLFDVKVLSPFGPYKIGDKIAKMDVSLISGKIDIHREGKDLLIVDIKPKFKMNCDLCGGSGQISVGYFEPEWDNCPNCTQRKGV